MILTVELSYIALCLLLLTSVYLAFVIYDNVNVRLNAIKEAKETSGIVIKALFDIHSGRSINDTKGM